MKSAQFGRPPRFSADLRSLEASAHLREKLPALRDLLERMRSPDGDARSLAALLEKALAEIRNSVEVDQPQTCGGSAEERILFHAGRLQRLLDAWRVHEHLTGALQTSLELIKADIKQAEIDILLAAAHRESVEQYMRDLTTMLAAAGVTARSARDLNSATVARIAEAIEGASDADECTRSRVELNLQDTLWQSQREWSDLIAASQYKCRPLANAADELWGYKPHQDDVISCGLPPFFDAERFDYTLVKKLSETSDQKKKISWIMKACRKWLDEARFPKPDSYVYELRKTTWNFLFCLRYNYSDQLKLLDNVIIASPFVKGELIVLERHS